MAGSDNTTFFISTPSSVSNLQQFFDNTSMESIDTDADDVMLMSSTCNLDHVIDILYTCAMFLMALAGILGNFLVIGAVCVHQKLRVISNAFIVNLAIADLMICIIADSFGIVGVITKGQIFKDNPGFCDFLGCVCVTSCCCSLWSITAIAINRYVAICHRLIYPAVFNRRTVPFMIAGLWILSFLIDVPALAGWGGHSYTDAILYCTYDFMSTYSYGVWLVIWQFGIPIVILSYSYTSILLFSRAIKKSLRKMQKGAPRGSRSSIRSTDLRLLKSVLIIWIIFCALWTPYVTLLLVRDVAHLPRAVFILSTGLSHLSSSVNCFVYGLTNQNFREGYVIFINRMKPCGTKIKSRIIRPVGTLLKSRSSISISRASTVTKQFQLNDLNRGPPPVIKVDNIEPIFEANSDDENSPRLSGVANVMFMPE